MSETGHARFAGKIREAPSAGAWIAYCAPAQSARARERLTGRPEHILGVRVSEALTGTTVYLVSAALIDRALQGVQSVPVNPGEIRAIPETER